MKKQKQKNKIHENNRKIHMNTQNGMTDIRGVLKLNITVIYWHTWP